MTLLHFTKIISLFQVEEELPSYKVQVQFLTLQLRLQFIRVFPQPIYLLVCLVQIVHPLLLTLSKQIHRGSFYFISFLSAGIPAEENHSKTDFTFYCPYF